MEPFIGEIRMFSGSYAPVGWALCQGQFYYIDTHKALYSILGTTYGGDGVISFCVPDLRGRTPIHASSSMPLGSSGGTETNELSAAYLPVHTHAVISTKVKCNKAAGDSPDPLGHFPAGNTGIDCSYISTAGTNEFMQSVITNVENTDGQPINNMMSYTCINFIIALQGTYSPRS